MLGKFLVGIALALAVSSTTPTYNTSCSDVIIPANTALLCWKGSPELVSYKIYYGYNSRDYIQPLGKGIPSVNKSSYVYNLPGSTVVYFAVTGIDSSGLETAYSDEMSKYIIE